MKIFTPVQSPEGLLATNNSQSAHRNAPGVFATETFDFQPMWWPSQALAEIVHNEFP
jgi:hypothetical protein